MEKNYQPWDIDFNDFYLLKDGIEKLQFLLKFAVLAPSTHNSQPWRFAVGHNEIRIMPNLERSLPVSDPDYRLLFISLGCAVENIVIAADYYNYKTIVEYFPQNIGETAIKIFFQPVSTTANNKENHLIFAIPRRRSNRSKYTTQNSGREILSTLQSLELDGASVHLISKPETRSAIADILMESRIRAFSSKPFRYELAHYKRTNLTRSSLGMPGFTMGFNTAFSLVAPSIIRYINIMRFLKKQEESLLKQYTPVFGFVVTQGNSKVDWLKAGRLFERVALETEHRNVQTAISIFSPQAREKITELLRISSSPQVFFRMGYASKIPAHSPRLSFEKVTERS